MNSFYFSILALFIYMSVLFVISVLIKKNSITKIRNRCILTNRARAVYRKFKISRLFFKKYALQGELLGVKKAS